MNRRLTKAGIDKTNLDSKRFYPSIITILINAMNAILGDLIQYFNNRRTEYLVGLNLAAVFWIIFQRQYNKRIGDAING